MDHQHKHTHPLHLSISLLIITASIIAFTQLIRIPTDGNLLFGFSLERLMLVFALALSIIAGGFLFIKLLTTPAFFDRWLNKLTSKKWLLEGILFILTLIAMISWLLLWKPAADAGRYVYYLERLKPILLVIFTWTASASFLMLQPTGKWTLPEKQFKTWLGKLHNVIFAFLFLLIFALLILVTGIGTTNDGTLWKMPGVPLLMGPIIIAFFILGWVMHWTRNTVFAGTAFSRIDALVIVVIIISTALWWVLTSQPFATYSPGPYPPSEEAYPFIDSANYDRNAIYAVMGEDLGNGAYVDKPFYATILVFLHAFTSMDQYGLMGNIQAAIYSVFTGLLYLLGKKLHSRYSGLFLAILGAIWGRNMIVATDLINTGSPKLFMTEFLSAILMVILAYALIHYFQHKNLFSLIVSGGITAIAVLVRYNFWLMVPLVFVLIVAGNWKDHKKQWSEGVIFLVVFLILMSPWMIRDAVKLGEFALINNVIVRSIERLRESSEAYVGDLSTMVGGVYQTFTHSLGSNLPALDGTEIFHESFPVIILNHAVHNILCAFLTLPRSFSTALLDTVITAENSLWQVDHSLHFSGIEVLWMLVHLVVMSIGFSAIWKRHRWAGLLPVAILVVYSLGLGVARTSGDRYITPIVWVILLYWAIGICEIFIGLLKIEIKPLEMVERPTKSVLNKIVLLFAVLLLVTSSPVWVDWVFPERMIEPAYEQFVVEMADAFQMNGYQYTASDIKKFIHLENSVYHYGLVYAPRWFAYGDGVRHPYGIYVAQPYDRLVFELLGKEYKYEAHLPIGSESLQSMTNGSEAISLACKREELPEIVIAMKIWDQSGRSAFYVRNGFSGLNCDSLP